MRRQTYIQKFDDIDFSRDLRIQIFDKPNNLIPEFHYIFHADGTIEVDGSFYKLGNRPHIPSTCTLVDWYRDIAFEGNGRIIDKIIAEGRVNPAEFDAMRQESSWMPTITDSDFKLLSAAETLNGHFQIYGPFNRHIEFFKQLMLIDWSKDAEGNYNLDYNHRLGLTEEKAKELVLIYGLVWNTDPMASIQTICPQDSDWWVDLGNANNELLPDGSTNQWAQISFHHLYQQMTSSGQAHLLFNPLQVSEIHPEWTSPDNIATNGWTHWLYPGDTAYELPDMSYFPESFLLEMYTASTFSITTIAPNNNEKIITQKYLTFIRKLFENVWHRVTS
nr:hypothetical protein [Candidatus Prometheoarchaeum syntrophicum]